MTCEIWENATAHEMIVFLGWQETGSPPWMCETKKGHGQLP